MPAHKNNKPYTNTEVITPDTDLRGIGRYGVLIATTVAGSVRLKLAGGNTIDVPCAVGANWIDMIDVIGVVSASTTGTHVVTALS